MTLKCNAKKINIISWISLGIMIITSIFLYASSLNLKSEYNQLRNDSNFSKELINEISHYKRYEVSSEGYEVNSDLFVEDIEGNLISFNKLINNNTLVFRFSETHCINCIPVFIPMLKELLGSKEDNLNVLILCDFHNRREIAAICIDNEISLPIYNMSKGLNIPIDKVGLPYFFVIDESLICRCFQVASKNNVSLSEQYFEGLKNY